MEPVLWLLFSGGGVVSALLLPVLVLVFALAVPLGWIATPEHGSLLRLVGHPLAAVVLLGLTVLSLFHWAQRFRYTLFDGLRLKRHQRLVNASVYTVAVLGSAAALAVLWQAVAARSG
ncbi:MAG TPA: hypothetical protein VIB11_15160 [Pedococcus sp.]|jgi:fumarate reductase subunit D|uniref:fumarate reductase subunit D n=1 Tax=Pedococcus sp. TaxID=2860345 RepID=UPI002F9377E3